MSDENPAGGRGSSPGSDRMSTAVLAVDTGGTFTDLVLLGKDGLTTLKLPSTPHDPSEAVLEGVRRLAPGGGIGVLVHGSTVATNALLERKGARVVLVTNRGFEDLIEIGRQNRPQLYALVGHRPPPLVAREDRVGISGRVGPRGEEIEPLDESELADLRRRVAGGDAVAVVLLHSYADPQHERRVEEALAGVGRPVSVSSSLLPEYREYERASTTVVNAYVAPRVSRYLGRLDAESGAGTVRIMGSNGGALPVARAAREPVHTVLSGPAGGVVGALAWATLSGRPDIITFDMGGTSTDVSLCPGRPLRTREFVIADQPVAIPVIDIHTVGAGGGSLARLDPGGALRVGPESSGAEPGPICYGRGGTALTVTDAHVWLGRLPVDAFLGGEGHLDRDAVAGPVQKLAGSLGASPEEAAAGIVAVADASMERALRVISVERGYDPVDFTLVAFGGAGGLHVAELARRMGVGTALVPPSPGLLSAYGMLAAPVTREASRSILLSTADPACEEVLGGVFRTLEREAVERLLEEGHGPEVVTVESQVDARYSGQSFELRVSRDGWVERFHAAHLARYGYRRDETPVEAVTLRAVASAPGPRLDPPRLPGARSAPTLEPFRLYADGREIEAVRVWRRKLLAGHRIEGPALVTEYSATTWVPEGWGLEVDPWGCLLLSPRP